MLQKKRIGRLRRNLALEVLEDRTVLSGNVIAFFNIFGGSQLIITGDNGNNAYSIHLTSILGTPTLSVTGSSFANPVVPGNVTAINSIPGGTVNVPLAAVSQIMITEGNGTNTIKIGNGGPISLLGNITITVGTGVDTVVLSNVSTNAGVISFTGQGGSTDNVSMTNVVAGAAMITTGSGTATVTQTNVTLGLDQITTGAGSDNVAITSSMFHPAPRAYAIGMLNVSTNGGNDSISITNIDVGPATIAAGTGNNTIKFNNSLIQQASITTGAETSGAVGSNKVDVSNDTIMGRFLNVNVLNQSGISGNGPNAPGGGSINTVTMNNVQFTGGGDLNLRVDDGIRYFNRNGNGELDSASTVLMQLVNTSGNINVTLGDFFQSVMLGVGTVGLNDLDSKNLNVSIGNFNDIVVITAIEQGSENVKIGNVATYPIGPLPPPSVLINGIVGAGSGGGNLTITLGTNGNTSLTNGWPINVSEKVSGNLSITGGDGLALNVSNTTVSGTLGINLGSGGVNHVESLTLMNVTSNDLSILLASNAADAPNGNPNAGVTVNLTNVMVNDPFGGLSMTDSGTGIDIVNLLNVAVANQLAIALSRSGFNVLSAQNVTSAFGFIDGGGFGSIYQDLGGNFGYFVIDFVGH